MGTNSLRNGDIYPVRIPGARNVMSVPAGASSAVSLGHLLHLPPRQPVDIDVQVHHPGQALKPLQRLLPLYEAVSLGLDDYPDAPPDFEAEGSGEGSGGLVVE
jgi:hypothetical protein